MLIINIIQIDEDADGLQDSIPIEFLANGIETSEEIFEVITFKTFKTQPKSSPINATHVLCDKNNENCRYVLWF